MSSSDTDHVSGGDIKACPYCGESILEVAKVCRYCGRDLVRSRRKPLLVVLAALIVLALVTSGALLLHSKKDALTIVNETLNCQSSKAEKLANPNANSLNYIAMCTDKALAVDFDHGMKGEPLQYGFDNSKVEAAMKCAILGNKDEPEKSAQCLIDKGLVSAK